MTASITLPSGLRARLLLVMVVLALAGVHPVAAQSGADVAASITGNRQVRIGNDITYTITATNIGDEIATDVQISGWVPDWFDGGTVDCLSGRPAEGSLTCNYPILVPGASVSMTITLKAVAGNKRERHMYELGWVSASNDTNPDNNEARIEVIMTGPCRHCPNRH